MWGRQLRMGGRNGDQEGSATIWVMVVSALLGIVAMAAFVMSTGFVAHRKAAAAADLAALAAATLLASEPETACTSAESVARANGAKLLWCQIEENSVLVLVEVNPSSPWLPSMKVPARAGYA